VSAFFNTTFLNTLKAGWTGGPVVMYMFPQAPAFTEASTDDTTVTDAYIGIDLITNLETTFGWGPSIRCPAQTSTVTVSGTLHLADVPQAFNLPDSMTETEVRALVFARDNGGPTTDQIMFGTDTLTSGGLILRGVDGIVPVYNSAADGLLLFMWYEVEAGAGAEVMPDAHEGRLLLDKGPPTTFYAARTQHVWVYPQRINFIANPSFENDTNFWRTNPTTTKSRLADAPPGAGVYSGRFTGPPNLIVESNMFPLTYGRRREDGWTIQLKARGEGTLKVGMLSWDDSMRTTITDWGRDSYTDADNQTIFGFRLSPGFNHIRTLRYAGDVTSGMLRLETDGTYLDIDQVCVEPGLLPTNGVDWPYFDGASFYGVKGDFSWYGNHPHASYSCWYDIRLATFGRLFGRNLSPEDQLPSGHFTDQDAAELGMAYQWVPAGTPVVAHMDVLYPNDPVSPLPPVIGSPLAYSTGEADLLGVTSPW
jgi:hypothetical protein